jgi:hypothetical protein
MIGAKSLGPRERENRHKMETYGITRRTVAYLPQLISVWWSDRILEALVVGSMAAPLKSSPPPIRDSRTEGGAGGLAWTRLSKNGGHTPAHQRLGLGSLWRRRGEGVEGGGSRRTAGRLGQAKRDSHRRSTCLCRVCSCRWPLGEDWDC